jgi:hypothetical protein
LAFLLWRFGFVSDFELRISDFAHPPPPAAIELRRDFFISALASAKKLNYVSNVEGDDARVTRT